MKPPREFEGGPQNTLLDKLIKNAEPPSPVKPSEKPITYKIPK